MGDGMTVVYTGGGKGKTTAALGIVLRACGYGKKVCMVQFIKGSWRYGEMTSSKRLGPEFEMIAAGRGFVGIVDDSSPRSAHEEVAQEAVRISRQKIRSGAYDIVILDEINYAVKLGLVSTQDVLDMIRSKPPDTDLVLTGNYARPEVVEAADLVTEMKEVKHPFRRGIKARKGIDF